METRTAVYEAGSEIGIQEWLDAQQDEGWAWDGQDPVVALAGARSSATYTFVRAEDCELFPLRE